MIFADRLVAEKGIVDPLKAISLQRKDCLDMHLVLAGEGQDRKPSEQKANELQIQGVVTFAG
jgi:glycosyltransferase involved in cell wall biosynthesis